MGTDTGESGTSLETAGVEEEGALTARFERERAETEDLGR